MQLFTAVVRHVSLKRVIRIVLLLNTSDPSRPRRALLFSTDTSLTLLRLCVVIALVTRSSS